MNRREKIEDVARKSGVEWRWDHGKYACWETYDVIIIKDIYGDEYKFYFCKLKDVFDNETCFVHLGRISDEEFDKLLNQFRMVLEMVKQNIHKNIKHSLIQDAIELGQF